MPGADDGREGEDKARATLKVTDRRHFTQTGERRDDVEESPEPARPEPPPPRPPASDRRAAGFERRPVDEPEGVDFTMLINAMAQPALLFLGEIPHPGTGKPSVNLEQARLQIDMLDLLRVKCRGNITAEEESLLERVLYQLRMLYVSRSSGRPEAGQD